MSIYALQKLIRDINRSPDVRGRFADDTDALLAAHNLTDDERSALRDRDYAALYRLGVHGLLLRPFSLVHQVSEPDYLRAISGEHP